MLVAVETFLPLVLAILGLPLLVLFTTLRPAKPHRAPSHSIEGPRPNQAWTIMKNIVKHGIPMTLDHGASDRVRSGLLRRHNGSLRNSSASLLGCLLCHCLVHSRDRHGGNSSIYSSSASYGRRLIASCSATTAMNIPRPLLFAFPQVWAVFAPKVIFAMGCSIAVAIAAFVSRLFR